MGLKILRCPDGSLRRIWYGRFRCNGKCVDSRLNVPEIRGVIPTTASGAWDMKQRGDDDFEKSRKEAEAEFRRVMREKRRKRDRLAELDGERKALTGQSSWNTRFTSLFDRWKSEYSGSLPTKIRQDIVKRAFNEFAAFAGDFAFRHGGSCSKLDDVSPEMARAYLEHLIGSVAWETARARYSIIRSAWDRWSTCRDHGNPFGAIKRRPGSRNSEAEAQKIGRRISRIPLTLEQLRKLFDLVRDNDPRIFPLVACVATTGLRIGDAVRLRWSDITLEKDQSKRIRGEYGFISGGDSQGLETSKTGAKVFLPILQPFADVLKELDEKRDDRDEYVFPDELERYESKGLRSNLYNEVKPFFALAVRDEKDAESEDVKEAPELEHTLAKITEAGFLAKKADRLALVAKAYFSGLSQKSIAETLQISKGQVCEDISTLEDITDRNFRANGNSKRGILGTSRRELMKATRRKHDVGKAAASVYGWHSLRATFVVLAVEAGVPLAMIAKAVGHSTVKMTLQYFNPTAKHEATRLSKALANVYALELNSCESVHATTTSKTLAAKEALEAMSPEEKKNFRRLLLEEAGLI